MTLEDALKFVGLGGAALSLGWLYKVQRTVDDAVRSKDLAERCGACRKEVDTMLAERALKSEVRSELVAQSLVIQEMREQASEHRSVVAGIAAKLDLLHEMLSRALDRGDPK